MQLRKSKQRKIQQNKTTLVQLPLRYSARKRGGLFYNAPKLTRGKFSINFHPRYRYSTANKLSTVTNEGQTKVAGSVAQNIGSL